MIKEKNNYKLYLLLSFVLVYMGSNTLFTQVILSTQYSSYLVFLLSIGLYVYNYRNKNSFQGHAVLIVSLSSISILLSIIINWDFSNFNGYVIILMKLLGAFLILRVIDIRKLIRAFSDVICLISVSSLIISYVFPLFSLEKMFPVITNSMGIRFYNCLLGFKIDSYGMYEIRNYGIFSEPAVFCYYLFLGALFVFAQKKMTKTSCYKVCILAFTMFTTFSPIGFLTAIIICIFLFYKLIKNNSSISLKLVPVFSLFVFLIIVAFNSDMRSGMGFTMSKATLVQGNGAERFRSFVACMKQWVNIPFFGGGLKAVASISSEIGSNTSTTGTFFVCFGVFFSVFVTYVQFISVSRVLGRENFLIKLLFYFLFILQINNHGLIQGDWLWLFTMIGVVYFRRESSNCHLQS